MASPAFMPACTALLVAAVLFPSSRENFRGLKELSGLAQVLRSLRGRQLSCLPNQHAVTWLALSAWAMTLLLSARMAPPLFARSAQPLFAQRPPLELLVPSLPSHWFAIHPWL